MDKLKIYVFLTIFGVIYCYRLGLNKLFTGEKYRAASPISAYSCSTASARLILKDWDMERFTKYKINFTQVSNIVLNDKRLSLKAKGLYAYLFSKPDNWVFLVDVILSDIKEGRDAFYSALKELIKNGYIIKYRERKENGKLGGVIYEFVDPTVDLSATEKPTTENPTLENPDSNNTNLNNNYINNIYINNNQLGKNEFVENSVDYGDKVLIGNDFKLNLDDEYFYLYGRGNKKLISSIEKWLIKNFLGQEVDKAFICRQISNFAKKQGCYMELLGIKEE